MNWHTLSCLSANKMIASWMVLHHYSVVRCLFYKHIAFLAVQVVPDGNKDSAGSPWEMIGLLPLFDPPRHDSAETIREALHLGVNVKMITGWCHHLTQYPSPNVTQYIEFSTPIQGLAIYTFLL